VAKAIISISPELNINALGLDWSSDRRSRQHCYGCRRDESDLHHGAYSSVIRRLNEDTPEDVPSLGSCSVLIPGGWWYHPAIALARGAAVKTKTYFAFRVDVWDGAGDNIVEHVAGVDDFETAVATYWAAVHAAGLGARIGDIREGGRPRASTHESRAM
jgi:hypothetical protein